MSVSARRVARSLRRLWDEATKSYIKVLNRTLSRTRSEAIKLITSKGIGRRVFAKTGAKTSARLLLKVKRFTPKRFSGSIVGRGIAALMETGGRLKPHTIQPRNAKLLSWATAGGAVFARSVKHPGAPVPKNPSIEPALVRAKEMAARDMDKAIASAARALGL